MAKTGKTAMDRVMDHVETWFQGAKPGEYDAGGKQVVCLHCGHTMFAAEGSDLGALRLAGLGGSFEPVYTLACARCGYTQWFLKPLQRRQS